MKKQNLRELSTDELKKQLQQKKEELVKMRFAAGAVKIMKNPAQYRKTKKDIARILTILRERELQELKKM